MANQGSTAAREGEQATSLGERLGLLYKRWVLDSIPQLGYAVSIDFSQRPELYKAVGSDAADTLTQLQSRYGYAPLFPNKDQRLALNRPIFGLSDGQTATRNDSTFSTARASILTAAAGFAENAQETSFPMHRERILSALVPFRRLLQDFDGASLTQTERRTASLFDAASLVLRDPGVATVFGINDKITAEWPLHSTESGGAKLIEKITSQLQNTGTEALSRDRFIRLQRIAEKGQIAITRIVDLDEVALTDQPNTLDELTAQLYAWGSDLGLVGGRVQQ